MIYDDKKTFEMLANSIINVARNYLEARMSEDEFRIAINRMALMEREIPYPDYSRCVAGEACHKAIQTVVLISSNECFMFKFNSTLPNRGLFTNQYLKNYITDVVCQYCEPDFGKIGKIHIRMEQYIKPTTTGKLRKDADNNEKKGVIDGITDALGIDDTGDRIAYSSTIKELPFGKITPYTVISLFAEKTVDSFFEELKHQLKENEQSEIEESISRSRFPEFDSE